jgi:hypothetical protein
MLDGRKVVIQVDDRCGVADMNGEAERNERLGGILNYYHRRAA